MTRDYTIGNERHFWIPSPVSCCPNCPAPAKWLYGALDTFASPNNPWVWPSVPTLAIVSGLGVTAVREHLRKLEACGHIIRKEDAGRSTEYCLVYGRTAVSQAVSRRASRKATGKAVKDLVRKLAGDNGKAKR